MRKIICLLNKVKDLGYNNIHDYYESIESDIPFEQVLDFVHLAFDQLNKHNAGLNNLTESEVEECTELLSLYSELNPNSEYNVLEQKDGNAVIIDDNRSDNVNDNTEEEDYADNQTRITIERDCSGKIQYYHYNVWNKGRLITGRFYRDEMQLIYREYSRYGCNLTQAAVNDNFPNIDPRDFRSILNGFAITKDSKPFAPHMYEEHTDDELLEIDEKERELRIHRRSQERKNKKNENVINKLTEENDQLRKILDELSNIKITLSESEPYIPDIIEYDTDQSINLYLADMHIGACVDDNSLYDENKNYGKDECKRRLSEIIKKVKQLGPFNTVNLILLGDNIDCCGHYGKTYQMKHEMPENMRPTKQYETCIELILWFIDSLYRPENKICSHINVLSVPCGNHTGPFEYAMNDSIMSKINEKYPKIKTTLWKETYGIFDFLDQTFVCTHGRTPEFMKKPLPFELDNSTIIHLIGVLKNKNITKRVHVVKGDLHSSNFNECEFFTYRNVLSIFGASDYSSMNYKRSAYGMSYDIIKGHKGETIIRGAFENV